MENKLNKNLNFYRYLRYKLKKNLNQENLNLKGDLKIKKNIVEEIKKNGFYVIENFISKDECKQIKKRIDKFIKQKPNMVWKDDINSDTRIFGAENICPKIKKFCNNNFIRDIGSLFFGKKITSLMVMVNKLVYKKKNLGSGQGWHKDSYAKQFKSILYLSDVNKKNGPFQLLKNTNSIFFDFQLFYKNKKNLQNSRFTNNEIKFILANKKKIENIHGKMGTLILVDTSLIHRGKPIEDGTRYAMTNYLYPRNTIKNFDNHFLPRVK